MTDPRTVRMFNPNGNQSKIKPGNKGAYTLRVSTLKIDWPGSFQSESQMTSFCNGYIRHARQYLTKLGYSPVNIQLVDGYVSLGQFAWNNDNQRDMRNEVMADYLSPAKPKAHDLNYLSGASDSPKG